MDFLPPDVGPWFAAVLIIVSAFTSFLTAALGLGGGLGLLAVMATGLPTATMIPVHGVVQFGSNFGRSLVLWRHTDWRAAAWFCGGGLAGAAAGGGLVTNLPDAPMKVAIGLFILLMTWGPKPHGLGSSTTALTVGGALGGALTMGFGATGPFTAAVLAARNYVRQTQVATFSVCMSVQHIVKVVMFGLLGFAFAAWVPLMGAMIASGFVGTLIGARFLHRLPEEVFRRALKWITSLLALQVLIVGAWALIP